MSTFKKGYLKCVITSATEKGRSTVSLYDVNGQMHGGTVKNEFVYDMTIEVYISKDAADHLLVVVPWERKNPFSHKEIWVRKDLVSFAER